MATISPRQLKRQYHEMVEQTVQLQKNCRNTIKRQKRTKGTCERYIYDLEKANLLNAELTDRLDLYKGVLNLFCKILLLG